MKKKILILIYLITCLYTAVKAQGFLHADGTKIVNEKGDNIVLRGMGLGGWMLQEGYMLKINKEGQQYRIKERLEQLVGAEKTQEFYDLWLKNHTTKADIDSLKAWGFNSVRLPIHYNLYTLSIEAEPVKGKNTWLKKGFEMTDSLLSWCKANQMYLILDLHAAPGGQGSDLNISDRDPLKPSLWDDARNQQKTIALWQELAKRYVNEPWIGAYDLINEPNWGFQDLKNDKNGLQEKSNAPLRNLMVEITKAIRVIDSKHLIIIEGNGWGNNYNGILPAWDKNMALSFHKYWNYNDQASIAHIVKMREQYQMPVWLGETGENSNVWFADAIRLLEKNNIGWSWWPLKKIGINNPVEIKFNKAYKEVVAYFSENGAKPSSESAYSGIMKLAADSKIQQAVIHRDVIDAMIRQPFSSETKSFKPNMVLNNAVLEAVDYDLGINGAAYHDKDTADYHVTTGKTTPGNTGKMYRNDGVDIFGDSSCYVGKIEDGEWLQYTIDVKDAGTYTLQFSFGAASDSGKFSVMLNGILLAETIIANGSNALDFKPLSLKNVHLDHGKQVLRVSTLSGGYNFKSIKFIKQ
jgi:endoglucanase